VRFIAATNRDLEVEVERGTFRRDLYFRLNGVSIRIPPLRERRSEIRPLAMSFLHEICQELGRPEPRLSHEVMAALEQGDWPGNVRELKNVIERAVLLCGGAQIGLEHLPEKRRSPAVRAVISSERTDALPREPLAAPDRTPEPSDERQRIMDALAACAGNQSRAAKLLDMPRRTFVAKLDRYRIPRPNKG
jgi:two-component system response regulator AtoC